MPPPLIFQAQSPRCELSQRRHFATGSSEIAQEFLAAHLLLAERNRGHKVLHLQVVDEAMFDPTGPSRLLTPINRSNVAL